jgi:mannose-6-phosphate isomerase
MMRFAPIYQPTLWGGRRLAEKFGRTLPEGPVGESWELVDFGGYESRTLNNGLTLAEVWRTGELGGSGQGHFPFLLKWIDTQQFMSIQVHPDASLCKTLGRENPKTEAWFVAHADPGATMLLGHYPGLDAATLKQAALGGTLEKWLYEVPVHQGEIIFVPAGTLHRVGAGLMLLEVQEPSNSTFRLYDWGRVDLHGMPRELRIDEGAMAVHYAMHGAVKAKHDFVLGPRFSMRKIEADAVRGDAENLRVFVAALGPAQLVSEKGVENLHWGDVVIGQPQDGAIRIAHNACLVLSEK